MKKKKAEAAAKSGGGLGGNPESAAVRNRSGTQTLNNYSSSSSTSCEDVPICFFLSTKCNNNSTKKQWNPCKWYVLQSESESSWGSSGGGDDDDDDGGLCPILIEKQISFETTNNDDKDTIEKKIESSCRLIQLPSFPSSLPSVREFALFNYRLFVFKSRIYLLGGLALPPPSDPYRPFLKGAYRFDTRFFPDKYHNHNGWRKSPDMLSNRFDIAATSVGSKIYLMGVVGPGLPFGEVLDPTLDCDDNHHSTHWSRELPELPFCLRTVGRVAMVGVVEDFGGKKILLYSRKTQQLFYYDINCNCWSVVADNFGFWTGRLTVALGCVFCFGQLNRYDQVHSLCAYDLATRSWLPVEGLNLDGDMMPPREFEYLDSANLFHINHNKLAFVWTLNLPCVKQGYNYSISLHYSKFFIHKTANCIRVHPSFCLSANVRFTGLPTCIPLIGKCFGLRDLEYYEEEIGGMEFMLGDTTKECGKTVVTKESVTRQHMSSHVSSGRVYSSLRLAENQSKQC